MKRDPAPFTDEVVKCGSAAVTQIRKWRVDTIKYSYRIHQHRFTLLYGSITDLMLLMKMTGKSGV